MKARKEKSPGNRTAEIFLLLHDIRSAHNVGAIFRTADAAGVSKIYLTGYTPQPIDRFGRKVSEIAKTALGGEVSVAWEYRSDPVELLRDLNEVERSKKETIQIVAIEQTKNSVNYRNVKIKKPVLFIVGNEVDGIPKKILNECDVVAEIPMKGKKESLNVAVALGIALFQMLGI